MIAPLLDGRPRHPQGWPCRLAICGAYELRRGLVAFEATHVLRIERPGITFGAPVLAPDRLLTLEFDDLTDASLPDAPTTAHLEAAIAFVDRLPAQATLVVHCLQGVSRSTALALGLLAREVPPLRAAYLLHALRPFACPNSLVVRLWDDLLGLRGELVAAAEHFPAVVWREGDGRRPQRRSA